MIKAAFVRHFAIGDILLALPIIEEYKKINPSHHVTFFTSIDFLGKTSYIDEVKLINDKNFRNLYQDYKKVFFLNYEILPKYHIQDIYSFICGLEIQQRLINYELDSIFEIESKKIIQRVCDSNKDIIVIQTSSGDKLRNLPKSLIQNIIDYLDRQNLNVIILSDIFESFKNCINFTGKINNLNLIAGIIKNSNFFFGIDSGLLHFAQAFDIPSIAVFGPTNPALRISNPNKIHIITKNNLSCLGCYHQMPRGSEKLKICKRLDHICMNGLNFNKIKNKIEFLVNGNLFKNKEKNLSEKKSLIKLLSRLDSNKLKSYIDSDYEIKILKFLKIKNKLKFKYKLKKYLYFIYYFLFGK